MENLKEKRLGYGYSNAKGEQMLVTEYRSNKRVVVKNLTTGTTHQCRWCDLQNVRCTAVYDATAARNRFKEELDAARNRFNEELDKVSAINSVTEAEKPSHEYKFSSKITPDTPNVEEWKNGITIGRAKNFVNSTEKPANGANSARTDLSDEVIRKVKESKEWAFQDDLQRDYDEGNGGCASVVVGVSIVLVVVGLLAWLLI